MSEISGRIVFKRTFDCHLCEHGKEFTEIFPEEVNCLSWKRWMTMCWQTNCQYFKKKEDANA